VAHLKWVQDNIVWVNKTEPQFKYVNWSNYQMVAAQVAVVAEAVAGHAILYADTAAAAAKRAKAAADQIQAKMQQDAADAAEEDDREAAAWRALQEQADADKQDEEDEEDETATETMAAEAQAEAEAAVQQPAPVAPPASAAQQPAPVAPPVPAVQQPVRDMPQDPVANQPRRGAPPSRAEYNRNRRPINNLRNELFRQLAPIITEMMNNRGVSMRPFPPYKTPVYLHEKSTKANKDRIQRNRRTWRDNNDIHICTKAPREIINEAFQSLPYHGEYTAVMERYFED
jgi:hypothetical protein